MRHSLWLVLLLAGCGRTPAESPPAPPAPSAAGATAVTLGPPVRQSLKRSVEQPGHVEAFERTALHSKVPGFVKAIHVDIGDRVTAGQLLAEIDEPEMEQDLLLKQAAVAQSQAEVGQAQRLLEAAEANRLSAAAAVAEAQAGRQRVRANYDRWKSESQRVTGLVERKVIDEQTRDETLNQFRAAEAALEEVEAKVRSAEAARAESDARRDKARADVAVAETKVRVARADEGRTRAMLGYARITAPFDGVVTARHVDTGHFLQPSGRDEPLFVVARADPVRVFVEVPEADAAFVKEGEKDGTPAVVRIQGLKGRPFAGRVRRTSWALDARSRTLRTEIDLPNAEGVLRPGMYAYASLTVTQPEAWTLPAGAVVRQGDAAYAVAVRDGKAVRVPVQAGVSDGKFVEVLAKQEPAADGKPAWAALTGSERFVVSGAASLGEGQAVVITEGK
jgi:RND family efflux transporter MFP subunit